MLKRFFLLGFLTTIAIAQPIFDIYSKNLDFLITWEISNLEIVYIVLLVYALIPLTLMGILWLAYRLSTLLGQGIYYLFTFILSMVFILQIFKQIGMEQPVLVIALSSGISFLLSYLFIGKNILENYIGYIASATLVIPSLFVYSLASENYLSNSLPKLIAANADKKSDTPVVLLIFDEFPIVTLLNKAGEIDTIRFPNFAKFAGDAVWYRDFDSKALTTIQGVPQIVTGVARKPQKIEPIPNYKKNPNTVFTLLGSTHAINNVDGLYHFCPPNLCNQESISTSKKAMGFMYDTSLIYLQLTLPAAVMGDMSFTRIQNYDFGGFLDYEVGNHKILRQNKLLRLIHESNDQKPAFFYMHNMLPHILRSLNLLEQPIQITVRQT